MRIAVISDTHGDLTGVVALREQIGPVDALLHAGDHFADAPRVAQALGLPQAACHAVVGNCDWGAPGPKEAVLELGGVRIFLVHGHNHGVKAGLLRITYAAAEAGARVAVFGHSHVPVLQEASGILLLNPGSPTQPRWQGPPSVAVLTISEQKVAAEHIWWKR
jgi:putative phosphoesterase